MGINLKEWLRRQRMVTACGLLRETDKIESVGRILGFRFGADFASEFRRMVGVSPSKYIRSERSRMFGVNMED